MRGKKSKISLTTYTNIAGSIVFTAIAVIVVLFIHHNTREHALQEAEAKAKILLDRTMATHDYFTHDLKPQIFALTDGTRPDGYFDPIWMSSTYANRKMDEYFKARNSTDYYFKNAAINARSPENEANDYERAFLNDLNTNPELITKSTIQELDGKPYFVLLRRGLYYVRGLSAMP